MSDEPTLLWSYIDKNALPWKSYGFYSNGKYYSGHRKIGRWKVKSLKTNQ